MTYMGVAEHVVFCRTFAGAAFPDFFLTLLALVLWIFFPFFRMPVIEIEDKGER